MGTAAYRIRLEDAGSPGLEAAYHLSTSMLRKPP